jgi:RecA/RadA recombinase
MHPRTLDAYLSAYGNALATQAARGCRPLHVPGKDPPHTPALLRPPFEAQAHVITAGAKALQRQRAIQIAAEMGTGKTLISQAIVQAHSHGRGYRAIVFCPPHLVHKWEREILETLENAHVHHLQGYRDLTSVAACATPIGRGWWILSNTRAKMGPKWEAAYVRGWVPVVARHKGPRANSLYCPRCAERIEHYNKSLNAWTALTVSDLEKNRTWCEKCGEPLWQWTHEVDRWPVAAYIHKHLPGWFQYLIIDESHQTKSADTAVGHAMGALAAACGRTICLTGTLLGGYAWHVRPLLFRIAPRSLLAEGLGWRDASAFDERYGRIEKRVVATEQKGRDNRHGRGRQSKTTKYVRPGVMPTLFGRHLIQNTIFLSLDEIADNLPRLDEEVIGVSMDPKLGESYTLVEDAITKAVRQMLARRDKRLLSRMLHVLLGYPDYPFDWQDIGYYEADEDSGNRTWVRVITPPTLPTAVVRPKEAALLDILRSERQAGRRVWVYSTMTDTRDVSERLRKLIADAGLHVSVLRSSVETTERETWIAKHGPMADVIISHPQLVETGLDLFDKRGSYNFPTLVFYQTGYNLFTLRQASRRSWRIGQTEPCRVIYLHYEQTMQARAMTLMGKKLSASSSIEGKFSSEGLAALAGDEGTLEVAMAKSLVEKLKDDLDVGRAWKKIGQEPRQTQAQASPPPSETGRKLCEDDWLLPPRTKAERHLTVNQRRMF